MSVSTSADTRRPVGFAGVAYLGSFIVSLALLFCLFLNNELILDYTRAVVVNQHTSHQLQGILAIRQMTQTRGNTAAAAQGIVDLYSNHERRSDFADESDPVDRAVLSRHYRALDRAVVELSETTALVGGDSTRAFASFHAQLDTLQNRLLRMQQSALARELSMGQQFPQYYLLLVVLVFAVAVTVTCSLRRMVSLLTSSNRELVEHRHHSRVAQEEKVAFLTAVGHEIRTPMTSILGYTDLVADPQTNSDDRQRYTHVVRQNGEQLMDNLSGLLELSRLESGAIEVTRSYCSPGKVINEVVQRLAPRAHTKGLALSCSAVGEVPARLLTDEARVRQVLTSLIDNAIKFTNSGSVRITYGIAGSSNSRFRMDVSDTGIGLSADEIKQLFQPLGSGRGSSPSTPRGVGIGLSFSSRFASLLDATLEVASKPGEGSVFSFVLPLATATDMAPLGEIEYAGDPERFLGRVLVAEDTADSQQLIRFFLERAGATVETVSDGREAVSRALEASAAGRPFDVILMDMQMPRVDGYAATTELRNEGYTGLILALTAHAGPADRGRCLVAGCDEFIPKPVEAGHLIREINAAQASRTVSG